MTSFRPIGEIFEHPGHHEKLIVVEALGCDFCDRYKCGCEDELTGLCGANYREDERSVQFVTLSKHIQHKLLGDYGAA